MILALLLALAQDTPASLVERLGAEDAAVRAEAERKLRTLGKAAVPALERAAKDGDAEVSALARRLLDLIAVRVLVPEGVLKSMPGVEDRVLREGEGAWADILIEAVDWHAGRRRYPEIGRADLDRLAEKALRGAKSAVERREACVIAKHWVLPAAAPALVDLLADPVGEVRHNASEALVAIGARDQVARILPMLKHETADVRIGAALCISGLGARETAKDVATLLADREEYVVHNTLWSLRRLAAPEAAPAVRPFLSGRAYTLRQAAVQALAAMNDRESVPRLREILAKDSHVEAEAMEALADLRVAEALPDILLRLKSRDFSIRMAAVRSLDRLDAGDPEAIEGLQQDPDEWVRTESAAWLAHRGDPRGGALLLRSPGRLDSLNGARQPDLWTRLRSVTLKGDLEGTTAEIYARLAERAGLRLELPANEVPSCLWPWRRIANTGDRLSVVDALHWLGGHYQVIVDTGRLRLLSQADAIAFWRQWLSERK